MFLAVRSACVVCAPVSTVIVYIVVWLGGELIVCILWSFNFLFTLLQVLQDLVAYRLFLMGR